MLLEDYLKELRNISVLELNEERQLWFKFKEQQNNAARQRLIESYQPLVFKCAMPYRELDNIMDLIQEGTVGLIESVEKFEYKKGIAFSLYAMHRIRGRIIDYLRREGRSVSNCTEFSDELIDNSPTVYELFESHYMIDKLRNAMNRLPQKERTVLESIYLDSEEARTVANKLELSVSHIYRLQKQGIRRIRGMLSRFMQKF